MPITYKMDHARGVLHTTATGQVTLAEIQAHILTLRRTQGETYPELIDARQAGVLALSFKDMVAAARLAFATLGHHIVAARAVIVSADPQFKLARAFAALVAGWVRVGVFEDCAAAELWLLGMTAGSAAIEETTETDTVH